MTALKQFEVAASIVLARHKIRLRDLTRLERGSVVPLGGSADSPSELHVNGVVVALGQVQIDGERTAFAVRDMVGQG